MARHGWKWLAVAGLCGVLGLAAGCNERQQGTVKENARQVGQEVGRSTREVERGARKAGEQVKDAAHEASEGFKEGSGKAPAGDKRE